MICTSNGGNSCWHEKADITDIDSFGEPQWQWSGLNDEQMEEIRTCVQRDRPLGPEAWVRRTAARLGLECTLRGPGRPRTNPENQ